VSWSFSGWRRSRILRRVSIDESHWRRTLARYPFLIGLNEDELKRLKERAALFLHAKELHGAAGLVLDAEMKLAIAVQACFIALNLPHNWYDGWVEIIVYPDEFLPKGEWEDEFGVVHQVDEAHAGQAWLRGPVILSWADVASGGDDGVNVVIHEFAHKLDMLNGDANGYPPLHAGMDHERWRTVFSAAFADFCAAVDRNLPTAIDPYAAESPGEFFAVVSEAFFELPETVRESYPEVYEQLAAFYRQDPYARHIAAGVLQTTC
jgi:Mlc titration factor MtfA (ptsG expression regulator)